MFSACQAVFTVGRFVGVLYLKYVFGSGGGGGFSSLAAQNADPLSSFPFYFCRYVDPAFALFANGVGLIIFSILTATIPGKGKELSYPLEGFNTLKPGRETIQVESPASSSSSSAKVSATPSSSPSPRPTWARTPSWARA